jgi:hypothetical protein
MVHERDYFVLKLRILLLIVVKFLLKALQNQQIPVLNTFLLHLLIVKFALEHFNLIFQILNFLLLLCDDLTVGIDITCVDTMLLLRQSMFVLCYMSLFLRFSFYLWSRYNSREFINIKIINVRRRGRG